TAAGVFTRNQVKAAPVLVSAQHLQSSVVRGIVFNAGNANCCTGERGEYNARRMCELAAAHLGCAATELLVCSTGIIGHQLPMEKVEAALNEFDLSRGDEINQAVARASMTTDTVPKYFAAQREIDGQLVTVGGQAKGVGMIGPNMGPMAAPGALHATMLAFLTTDAQVEKARLQSTLQHAVERTFNSVTVDGDTSTNDTCLLLANGQSGITIGAENQRAFGELVELVCLELAKKVVRDGEGATKLVTIEVTGAPTEGDAKTIALTIANSPLVKTAIFGRDPNWGRLAMAAGRAGVPFDAHRLSIQLGEVQVFRNGEPTDFDLHAAEAAMEPKNLSIRVRIGDGPASWCAWTCDFSYDYVKINAEYHT
ncbi:MAG: glutamate N-acetyltransferase / amino-acid N-acetyltransferase, partial [Abditibacteriota bacterium]|nr:glutamate N-acetyltransferase / amino-acid N-acetyltransferase [Abditibacteriota bacterium]